MLDKTYSQLNLTFRQIDKILEEIYPIKYCMGNTYPKTLSVAFLKFN